MESYYLFYEVTALKSSNLNSFFLFFSQSAPIIARQDIQGNFRVFSGGFFRCKAWISLDMECHLLRHYFFL